ncbi:putative microtubule binding protein [Operophtera brumata]|uniref:Putative microtubule binding protein n=1 Tax=Operophtera brumata TaxID=104452 RepID=A0A0L7KNR3_OPEBR|nr:putative microtubule binding protein [Operophtera brumata]
METILKLQIDNTPEHIRRARRSEKIPKEAPKEECPRLIFAPFSRPPQVVFDNVLIGSSCERNLELYNPSKQIQQRRDQFPCYRTKCYKINDIRDVTSSLATEQNAIKLDVLQLKTANIKADGNPEIRYFAT